MHAEGLKPGYAETGFAQHGGKVLVVLGRHDIDDGDAQSQALFHENTHQNAATVAPGIGNDVEDVVQMRHDP